MNYTALHIKNAALNPDRAELLRHLPGGGDAIDQHTMDLTGEMIKACQEVMAPQGAFVEMQALASPGTDEIAIPGVRFHTGKTINKMLRGAERYVFFMATAGPGPEVLAKTLMTEGQYLEAYIVDLIASSMAEAAAQYLHDHLKEEWALKGQKITNRYSPGYCGWQVDEQQKLFGLFPEGSCGITLSSSSLMSPIKSVSGFVGVGPEVNFRDYTCELCSMKDCSFRKTRHTRA